MRTIANIVETIVTKSPFLLETIEEDIANLSKIARRIKIEVEKKTLEKVSEAAIVAALRRMEIKPSKKTHTNYRSVGSITVRSDLVEFIFYNPPDLLRVHQEILEKVGKHDDVFLNIARGNNESLVVVSKKCEKDINMILKKQEIVRTVDNLASVTLNFPAVSMFAPGVYYPFLKALYWENISFVEIISIANELSFIFEDKDIEQAFSIIKSIT